jgi:hypothetical protein
MVRAVYGCVILLAVGIAAHAADSQFGLQEGNPDLKSAGPLAFGPDGILLVGDTREAAVWAIATGDTSGNPATVELNVEGVNEKIAALLGTTSQDIQINDMVVNPLSGNAYFSVSRGRGPDASPVLVVVDTKGQLAELSLKGIRHAKSQLANAPAAGGTGRRDARAESITDLLYYDGRVYVAGLSNEEFASKLRSIAFPFQPADRGTSVEIYHGSHGGFETRSPVRTFVQYDVESEPHLLAAYTCTPLVKIPIVQLAPGVKIVGTTVAELGNRNRPLDMVVYQKDGQDYILMANSSRGVMKVTTQGIDKIEGITERVSDTAGLTYETISQWQGVVQLDRLNDQSVLLLVQSESGPANLKTVALP